MHKINISTRKPKEIVDITPQIQDYITAEKLNSGIVLVYSPHTTAAITVNENADPDVKRDLSSFLDKTIPKDSSFRHAEGNSDAHIKGSLLNFSQAFIVEEGSLQLGTWQGIFFMEFDGPRERNVWVKFLAG